MQNYVTPFGLTALLVPHLLVVALLIYATSKRINERGWTMVSPGLSYWLPCIGSVALSLLIIWVWAYVGSARRDAAFQMQIAWWLAFVFAWSAAWCSWRIFVIHKEALRWRGSKVRWRGPSGDMEKSLLNIRDIGTTFAKGTRVTLFDGTVICVDNAAQNSSDFLALIEELNGLVDPDGPGEH